MSVQILHTSGVAVENSYLVKLKEGADKQAHLEHVRGQIAALDGLSEVTHDHWDSELFHGYAGKFSGSSLDALLRREDVEYIEEDSVITESSVVTQTNAPWGLARICQDDKLTGVGSALNFKYSYDSNAGSGVDVYILDSGIYTGHFEFEGRASWGKTFTGTDKKDKTGHGTHVAGIVGSKRWGVAKAVKLIAVKIIDDQGSGTVNTFVDGMNWVKQQAQITKRPSIANVSAETAFSQSINNVVDAVSNAGIHVVVSAGNGNKNAVTVSPASASRAYTVGATTFEDKRHYLSNFGALVDVFAPGGNITSCGIDNPNSVVAMSGCSMACPHVAGLVAFLIKKIGNIKPELMIIKVKEMSVKNKLADIPSGTLNNLARNDFGK